MINEKSEAKKTLVSIDTWRDDPSKVRIFIEDRDTIIIPKDYLYEMKRCIDTVLGADEECSGEGRHCFAHDQPHTFCEKEKEETTSNKPLTEGEKKNRDGMRDRATVAKENMARKEKNDLRNRYQPTEWEEKKLPYLDTVVGVAEEEIKVGEMAIWNPKNGKLRKFSSTEPQQESKEEECCHGCSTGKSCEKAEEPSKKPSTRISEIRKNITSGGSFKVWYGNDSLTAIVEYLDELHERKVI